MGQWDYMWNYIWDYMWDYIRWGPPRGPVHAPLGDSLAVELSALTRVAQVQILVPQPAHPDPNGSTWIRDVPSIESSLEWAGGST